MGLISRVSSRTYRKMSDDELNISIEEETTATLLYQLQNLMINEKLAPEPLQHQEPLIKKIQSAINHQKSTSKSLSSNIESATTVNLINLEIQRTEYMLKSYLRTRIQKLEKFSIYYETRLSELVEKCPNLDGENLNEEDKADFEFITTVFTDDELDFIRESS